MKYKVLHTFREKEHDDTVYEAGDIYPKEGYKADAKRVKFLQGRHKKYKVSFLGEEVKEEDSEKSDDKSGGKDTSSDKKEESGSSKASDKK